MRWGMLWSNQSDSTGEDWSRRIATRMIWFPASIQLIQFAANVSRYVQLYPCLHFQLSARRDSNPPHTPHLDVQEDLSKLSVPYTHVYHHRREVDLPADNFCVRISQTLSVVSLLPVTNNLESGLNAH